MASKRTGKIVKSIRLCKSKAVMRFEDGEKLDISLDTFSNFYLFKGKEISLNEYKKIKEMDSLTDLLNYSFGVVNKSIITEYKMREKLYNKGAKKSDVDEVIKFLKKHDLINDDAYIDDYLAYADESALGKNKIKDNLYQRGISKERIEKIQFNEQKELQKAKKLFNSCLKKYDKYVGENKKQHIYSFYLSHGFDSSIAMKILDNIPDDKKNKVKESLNKDYQIAMRKFSRQYDGRELFDHIYKSLRAKGYSYNEIKNKWEEKHNDLY